MEETNNIEYIKRYIENLKYEILEKQEKLNELISILNDENDTNE